MDRQRNDEYVLLFEKLLNVMTSSGECDRERLKEAIGELCEFFRVAKGTAEFYRSLSHEKMGEGLFYCEYDNGKAEKVLMKKRFVTNTTAVIVGTLYVAKDEPPLPEDEMAKLDVILRVILSYLRRTRLQNAIERLGYHDEVGYPNLRSFFRFLDKTAEGGELSGHTAIYFNLRHFSLINREIGRENGDKAMRNYIERLRAVIGEEGIVSRLGGDNFLAAFRNEVLEPVLEVIKGVPITYDERQEKRIVVSACAGVFCMPEGFHMVNSREIMDRLIPAFGRGEKEQRDFPHVSARC